jgi:hypothetical protein
VGILFIGSCISVANAQIWQPTEAPHTNWVSLACSADARNVVAAAAWGPICLSTNSGATWTVSSAPITNWSAVACSADGTKVVAVGVRTMHTSTDSGNTWNPTAGPLGPWQVVATSADGTTLLAAGALFPIAESAIGVSTNSGASWTIQTDYGPWQAAASSADGKTLVVAGFYRSLAWSRFIVSTDSGTTWVEGSTGSFQPWTAIAVSADGGKLAAATEDGLVATSIDLGRTWAPTAAPALAWSSLAVSADARTLLAVAAGSIYTSTDCGVTWLSNSAPVTNWVCAACSADGSKMFVANCDYVSYPYAPGMIYTLQSTPAPLMTIADSGNALLISWIVPSRDFGLEESLDLSNWSGVAATPSLNYTNLHYEVSLRALTSPRFYRLAMQQ